MNPQLRSESADGRPHADSAGEPVWTGLRDTLQAQLLRWAVGRAIFCRTCGTVLDVRRAVLLDSGSSGCTFVCSQCWDRAADQVRNRVRDLEVTDGRALARLDLL